VSWLIRRAVRQCFSRRPNAGAPAGRFDVEATRRTALSVRDERGTVITSRVSEIPADDRITGFVGLVIEPDAQTIEQAYGLSRELMPSGAESALSPGSLPHITLTQCAVREATRDRVSQILVPLNRELRTLSVRLRTVRPFGGGFLFWCVDEASPERATLQRVHEYSITFADGLLDRAANAAVVESTIKLTKNDARLVGNARAYGYAFVRDAYLPHITLGFDPRVIADGSAFAPRDRRHTMTVARVVLAKMGRYGVVDAVYAV
jgi:2'-5' RNA ligase